MDDGEQKKGAPAWMVSFGNMMTLILAFFILMVSMGSTQEQGLVATGIGSFVVAIRSFGLPGILDAHEKAALFDNVRTRFNLPPESDPKRREDHIQASNLELVRAQAAHALRPHDQFGQPAVATFAPGSAELNEASRRYLDLLAPTLRPAPGEVLLLEGHALDAGERHVHDDAWLAFERARAVRDYLVAVQDCAPHRIEVRAWLTEIEPAGLATRTVDARLIIPAEDEDD